MSSGTGAWRLVCGPIGFLGPGLGGYTDTVAARRLPLLLAVLAAVAAWAAARHALFSPLLWLFVLVACLALPVAERRLIEPAWLATALLLVGASLAVALDHELAVRHSLLLIVALLLVGLARSHPPSDTDLYLLALAIAATSVAAIVQASGGLVAAQAELAELPRSLREAAASRLAVGRAFGTASLPGHFAVLLLMAAPLLLGQALHRPWSRRIAPALGLVGVGIGIALTRSLAALAVAAVLVVVAIGLGMPRWPLLGGVGGVVVLLLAATVAWRGDLAGIEPLQLRIVNWRTAAAAFAGSPWLGVGLGGVGQAGLVTPTAGVNITPYAHNTYLQLLAETGLAGMPVVVGALVLLARVLRRGLRTAPGLALAVLVVPLHNLVDFSAYQPEILLPWTVLLGALMGRVVPTPDRSMPAWVLIGVTSVGCLVSLAAWRGETAVAVAPASSLEGRLGRLHEAARWQPWTLSPLLQAVEVAVEVGAPAPQLEELDDAVAARWWVRPRSSAWAQARTLLLLGQERRGEALVWAREARRRAPTTPGLDTLEQACAPR